MYVVECVPGRLCRTPDHQGAAFANDDILDTASLANLNRSGYLAAPVFIAILDPPRKTHQQRPIMTGSTTKVTTKGIAGDRA